MLPEFDGCKSFCERIKSRDMTYTRISRLLFHILLGIRDKDYETGKKIGYIPYLRLLGFREASFRFFSEIKKYTRVPLVTRPARELSLLNDDAQSMLRQDIFSSDLYYGTLAQKYHIRQKNELQRKLVKYPMEQSPLQ